MADDLDDLLDDIEIDDTLDDGDDVDTTAIKAQLPGLTDDIYKKWTKFTASDEGADKESKFLYSHMYRSWDDSKNLAKSPAPHKLLQEAVRQACTKTGFNEKIMAKIMSVTNPMETQSGKMLQDAYNRQILSDLKRTIMSSPDYDPSKFPSLAKLHSS